MLTLIFLMLSTYEVARGSLKTYCLNSKNNDCDDTWRPDKLDIDAALVGYDLPSGNPFSSDFIEDPGLRKQIFNATIPSEDEKDENKGFKLDSGISIREYKMCHDHFKTQIATSIKGYKKIAMMSSLAGFGYDIGIEAEDGGDHEGKLPSLVYIAWENGDDVKKLANFFTLTRGAVAISEAQCITHKIDVSHFLTPSFHPSFVGVLKILEQQDTEMKQERAFKRFVRDYGTHYLSSAFLGAKMSAITHFTSYERLKLDRQELEGCSSTQSFDKFNLKIEDKDENKKSTNLSQCWFDGDGDHVGDSIRTRLVSFGTELKSDSKSEWIGMEWKHNDDKKKIRPIPIKFELTPIVNLFNPMALDERYNISSTTILTWFLPLYLRYCKVLKYDCLPNRGCGYDDDCGLQETCVNLYPRGHRCEVLSWADVPNWPIMPTNQELNSDDENDPTSRSDSVPDNLVDPEPANVTWFRTMDLDNTGALSKTELLAYHSHANNWYNKRYRTAVERLVLEADMNNDRVMDEQEYLKLHEKHPWYSEQLAFLLMNTDNNAYLTKEELMEASKVSDDISALNFSNKQLENLIGALIGIGDKNGDKRITFDEYVHMSHDAFVNNIAPRTLKRVLRQ